MLSALNIVGASFGYTPFPSLPQSAGLPVDEDFFSHSSCFFSVCLLTSTVTSFFIENWNLLESAFTLSLLKTAFACFAHSIRSGCGRSGRSYAIMKYRAAFSGLVVSSNCSTLVILSPPYVSYPCARPR